MDRHATQRLRAETVPAQSRPDGEVPFDEAVQHPGSLLLLSRQHVGVHLYEIRNPNTSRPKSEANGLLANSAHRGYGERRVSGNQPAAGWEGAIHTEVAYLPSLVGVGTADQEVAGGPFGGRQAQA